jgi:DNA segregation ATPase FtsK/SpoIIIE-like protein
MYRAVDFNRWEEPFINPQANVEKKFHDNIDTRLLEKDYYKPKIPVLSGVSNGRMDGHK